MKISKEEKRCVEEAKKILSDISKALEKYKKTGERDILETVLELYLPALRGYVAGAYNWGKVPGPFQKYTEKL